MFGIRCLDFKRKTEIAQVIIGPLPRWKKGDPTGMTSSESSDSEMTWDVAFGNYTYLDRSAEES